MKYLAGLFAACALIAVLFAAPAFAGYQSSFYCTATQCYGPPLNTNWLNANNVFAGNVTVRNQLACPVVNANVVDANYLVLINSAGNAQLTSLGSAQGTGTPANVAITDANTNTTTAALFFGNPNNATAHIQTGPLTATNGNVVNGFDFEIGTGGQTVLLADSLASLATAFPVLRAGNAGSTGFGFASSTFAPCLYQAGVATWCLDGSSNVNMLSTTQLKWGTSSTQLQPVSDGLVLLTNYIGTWASQGEGITFGVSSTSGTGLYTQTLNSQPGMAFRLGTPGGAFANLAANNIYSSANSATSPAIANVNAGGYGWGFKDNSHADTFTNGIVALDFDNAQNANFTRNVTDNGNLTVLGATTTFKGITGAYASTKTSAYSLVASDFVVPANATSGAFAVTLQTAAAAGAGRLVSVAKTDSTVNTVTVTAAGTDTINGVATFVLTAANTSLGLVSDGTSNWLITGGYQPSVFQGTAPLAATGTQSTASTTFATIGSSGSGATSMSQSITTRGGTYLKVSARVTWSNSSNGGNNVTTFQLLLDGATVLDTASGEADGGTLVAANAPITIVMIIPTGKLSQGSHTIALQWKVSNTGTTTRCNVGTNGEGAVMFLEEVAQP